LLHIVSHLLQAGGVAAFRPVRYPAVVAARVKVADVIRVDYRQPFEAVVDVELLVQEFGENRQLRTGAARVTATLDHVALRHAVDEQLSEDETIGGRRCDGHGPINDLEAINYLSACLAINA